MHRAISVDGAVHLRDLGGHPTTDGGRVRPGRRCRSGSLAHPTARGGREFQDLGIANVALFLASDEAEFVTGASRLARDLKHHPKILSFAPLPEPVHGGLSPEGPI